jgi:hypothetical protein
MAAKSLTAKIAEGMSPPCSRRSAANAAALRVETGMHEPCDGDLDSRFGANPDEARGAIDSGTRVRLARDYGHVAVAQRQQVLRDEPPTEEVVAGYRGMLPRAAADQYKGDVPRGDVVEESGHEHADQITSPGTQARRVGIRLVTELIGQLADSFHRRTGGRAQAFVRFGVQYSRNRRNVQAELIRERPERDRWHDLSTRRVLHTHVSLALRRFVQPHRLQ